MKRRQKRRLITTLSVLTLTGGVVVSAVAGIRIESLISNEGLSYLPAATQAWKSEAKAANPTPKPVLSHDFLGTIAIPSIHKTANIFEGTDSISLNKGVGHFLQSVMPGARDNAVLAGHRDTVFAHLGQVKLGSAVIVTIKQGTFTYLVTKIRIVGKDDRTVIVPTPIATLTLSTCFPFTFFGDAPKRYIVIAELKS